VARANEKKKEVGGRIFREVLLKEVEMSRLFLQTKMDQQSDAFMDMLDRVVGYLDDMTTLDEKLIKLGETHLHTYKVKKRHFKHFRTAFLRAIKQYIPWTDRREAAWMWFWGRVIDRMAAENTLVPFALDMSPRQYMEHANNIHETFDAAIADDPQHVSDVFYEKLINNQPDIADLFQNTEIKQQGAKFVSMVRHCIHMLDDHRTFENKMVELGKTHEGYGVKLSQLQSFGDILIEVIRSYCPVIWTEKHTDSWQWFWRIVVNLFSRGILEKQEEKKDFLDELKEKNKNESNSMPNLNAMDDADALEEITFDLRGRFSQKGFAEHDERDPKLENKE